VRSSGRKILLKVYRRRWEDIIKMDVREQEELVWAGFIWLRIRTSGRLL
jgi:hypothetical protein